MTETLTLQLPITGMTCASCVARVEKAITKVPGVQEASVNGATDSARLVLAGASAGATAQAVAAAVAKAGYAIPSETLRLQISGMTCASCVGRVEKALAQVPGTSAVSVNLATNTAQLQRLAGSADDASLLAAVRRAGYEATLASDGQAAPAHQRGDDGWRVAVAAALSAPLVLPMVGDLFGRHWMLPALWQWLLATPVLFLFRRALLQGRLGGAAQRCRQHGPAGGHRHQRCLWPEPGAVGASGGAEPLRSRRIPLGWAAASGA